MLTMYYSLAAVLSLAASPLRVNAQAHLSYPMCDSSWSWTYNSLGQSPCAVAAHLQSVCGNGVFSIPALSPDSNNYYVGPTGPSDENDLCKCNTVVYSLMSACGACQGSNWFSWDTWKQNCTAVDAPQTFSNTIPNGTRVQEWAFIDVTERKKGFWDPVLSFQYGNQVEISPGHPATMTSLPAPTTTETSVPGLSSSQAQYLASKTKSSSKARKVAAIVGGVLGGIILVAAFMALFVWRARVKRRKATRHATAAIFAKDALPMQEKVSGD